MYSEDLAHIQHRGFGGFSRSAAPGLLAALRDAGIAGGTVVDLGCGAGAWLRELQRAGYAAHGLEASPALARIARRAAPGATVRVGSAHRAELPSCDAVTAVGEVLSYLPRPPLRAVFARVLRSLRPGGLFLFDLLVEPGAAAGRSWRAGTDWAVLTESHADRKRKRLIREITTFRRVGQGYRRRRETHELGVTPRHEAEQALRRAGFTVRVLRRYGSFALPPGRAAFAARRRTR